jgi:taurine--2-oxoglutarate transaminase
LLKESVASLEKIVAYEGPNNIAAILLEGESGSSGCFKYPVGYLKAVRKYAINMASCSSLMK